MEFYLYLNPSGSSHTLSDFVVVDPPDLRNLKGSWECALVELSMECNFTPKSDRLYLCDDFRTCPSLIKTEFNYSETSKSEENTISTSQNATWTASTYQLYQDLKAIYIRFTMVDEALQKMNFTSDKIPYRLTF